MHPATLLILGMILPFTFNGQVSAAGSSRSTAQIQKADPEHLDPADVRSTALWDDSKDSFITSLTRSLSRSECHADIAASLKYSCKSSGGGHESGLSEAGKRGIAISFTICSMRSALQQVPIECGLWHPSETEQDREEISKTNFEREGDHDLEYLQTQQAACLGALHRSPQEWSAYNAYLSDATQLCHALEARKQADLAHTRYLNATLEKISLIKFMKDRETAQLDRERKMDEELAIRSQDLREAASFIMSAQNKLRDDIDISSELRQDLRAAFDRLETERAIVWEGLQREASDRLYDADARFEAIVFDLKSSWETELSAALASALRRYDTTVNDRIDNFELAMTVWIQHASGQVDGLLTFTNDQITVLHNSWQEFYQWLDIAKKEVSMLDEGFSRLRQSLDVSMGLSQNISLAQFQVTQSLGLAMTQTETLLDRQDHLENSLNLSLALIEKSLKLASRWTPSASLSLFSAPAWFSFPPLTGFSAQIVFWTIQLFWQLAYATVSTLIVLLLLFYTGLRKSIVRWSERYYRIPWDEEAIVSTNRKTVLANLTKSDDSAKTSALSGLEPPSTIASSPLQVQKNANSSDGRRRNYQRSASAPL
uniref:Karyogamy protein 5 n=1 Tax=Kwoniella bestiolae CBS 10118 TaxID=1296100 RepID=A0A1B9G4C9_9TREE|nr:hypothetical protein I302_03524 [Kwoniella bestiolae CBS 10118]OCF25850.1 hypothetical protein I302_03524 [Kwoniella bestiolae CBS 10118]